MLEELKLKYFTSEELEKIQKEKVPSHVAIIMDGNRRFAKTKEKQVSEGHKSGADILLDVLKAGKELGIKYMTLFVFSTENWKRSAEEVSALMWLFENYIRDKTPAMVSEDIRFNTIGDISKFPKEVLGSIFYAREATKNCSSMDLYFAMNYGGRDEIVRGVKTLVKKVNSGEMLLSDITEESLSNALDSRGVPDPELLIRTGGEHRISNFLLWQISYSEVYITETLWPEFTPKSLLEAIIEYQRRERRHGS